VADKALIIGCGYIGLPLALELQKQGAAVTAWVHSPATAQALDARGFSKIVVGSVADQKIWSGLDDDYDLMIHCASSGRGGEVAYEEVFLQGAVMMSAYQARARGFFVSSTSVYGQSDGGVVTEDSPAEAATATAKILQSAEKVARGAGITVVRSSGIYGPGRGVLFDKLKRGEAVIEGDGRRWMNQIHQRDLVGALLHLAAMDIEAEIYNASDDTPVTQLDYYAWCAEFLGRPLPPFGPVNLQRKRGLTNKRVSNAKLRATGWAPIYPSYREGIAQL
jgi:nucleoside-diphosphate-sugar epimerase